MNALIWKESIYKNNFTCHCGSKLADNLGQPTDNVGLDADPSGRQDVLYCCNCREPVAIVREYNGPVPTGTPLAGEWKGEI